MGQQIDYKNKLYRTSHYDLLNRNLGLIYILRLTTQRRMKIQTH